MRWLTVLARSRGWSLVLLMGAIFLVYVNSLDSGFHFDDEHSLVGNPYIRSLGNVPAFFMEPQMFSRNVGSAMYRPLVLVSYALNYWVGGYEPLGYHLVNIGIHALVAILVYGVFCQLGIEKEWALIGALFFGIHPLTTEPVNYISSRSESLGALFFLSSFFLYARRQEGIPWLSGLCFAAGLASKSVVLTLPLVLIMYDWMLAGKIHKDGKGQTAKSAVIGEEERFLGNGPGHAGLWGAIREMGRFLGHCGRRHWGYWILGGIYLIGTRSLISEAVIQAPVRPLDEQLATQAKALTYYLRLLFLPQPLNVEHQFFAAGSWFEGAVIASLLLAISAGIFAVVNARGGNLPNSRRKSMADALYGILQKRMGLFWCGWMLVGLLPTLVVPLNVLVNERRLYLPLVGLAGLLLWLLGEREWGRRWSWILGVGLVALAALTVQRNQVWENERRLWEDALGKAPLMVRPYLRMGSLLRQEGNFRVAEKMYTRVLELDPENGPAHNNLGNLRQQQGDLEGAERAYRRALEIAPRYVEAQINLAALYSGQGHTAEALELYRQALELGGNREEIYNNLGTNYLRMGDWDEAEKALRQSLALNPDQAAAYFNLGGALEGKGRLDEAVAAYRQALEIDATYARAYYNLGILFEGTGELEEARGAYENFLRYWRGDRRFAEGVRGRLLEMGDGRWEMGDGR